MSESGNMGGSRMGEVSCTSGWMTRWFKGGQERRGARRFPNPGLSAFYWDGALPAPRRILNISETGAYVRAAAPWYPGTIIDLTVQQTCVTLDRSSAPPVILRVASKVVRLDANGLAVRFLYASPGQQRRLRKFLHATRMETAALETETSGECMCPSSAAVTARSAALETESLGDCMGDPVEAVCTKAAEHASALEVVTRTCYEFGLDPDVFIAMLAGAFGGGGSTVRAVSDPEFRRFLLKSLEWLPALTRPLFEGDSALPAGASGKDLRFPADRGSTDRDYCGVLEVVGQTCIQHGLDPEAFVSMLRSVFGSAVSAPEQASEEELMRFLLASLEWDCPPLTPLVARQQAEARAKWTQAGQSPNS